MCFRITGSLHCGKRRQANLTTRRVFLSNGPPPSVVGYAPKEWGSNPADAFFGKRLETTNGNSTWTGQDDRGELEYVTHSVSHPSGSYVSWGSSKLEENRWNHKPFSGVPLLLSNFYRMIHRWLFLANWTRHIGMSGKSPVSVRNLSQPFTQNSSEMDLHEA